MCIYTVSELDQFLQQFHAPPPPPRSPALFRASTLLEAATRRALHATISNPPPSFSTYTFFCTLTAKCILMTLVWLRQQGTGPPARLWPPPLDPDALRLLFGWRMCLHLSRAFCISRGQRAVLWAQQQVRSVRRGGLALACHASSHDLCVCQCSMDDGCAWRERAGLV